MREDLRRRLRKVLTPPDTKILRGADGGAISPHGMCGARITLHHKTAFVLFTVLRSCPHEIILGWDFLATHSALIDCAKGEIELDATEACGVSDPIGATLCCLETSRIPPLSAVAINVTTAQSIQDGDYIISPIVNILVEKQLAVPHCIAAIQNGATDIWVLNITRSPQILPKGMTIARSFPTLDSTVAVIAEEVLPPKPPQPLSETDLAYISTMIDPTLNRDKARQLHSVTLQAALSVRQLKLLIESTPAPNLPSTIVPRGCHQANGALFNGKLTRCCRETLSNPRPAPGPLLLF